MVVGISELRVSGCPDDVLTTYSLGSCLGVTAYDSRQRVGGLIHCLLPLSKSNPEKAAERPAMFVDTGIVELLDALYARGCARSDLEIRVAGAATSMDPGNHFRIGERNYATLRKVLWKNQLLISGEQVGGSDARTVRLSIATGRVRVSHRGEERDL